MPRSSQVNRYLQTPALQKQLLANRHDVFVLNASDMLTLFMMDKRRRFAWCDDDVLAWLKEHGIEATRVSLKFGATYAAALNDSHVLAILAKEMIRSGSILSRYREVTQNGRRYIVFMGYAGLRKTLTATRYGVSNPKVMALAVGKDALKAGSEAGFLIAIAFSITFDVVNWMANDKHTIQELVAEISTDLIKNAISTAAALGASLFVASGGSVIAVAPIAAGIVVALGVGYLLNVLDDEFGLTEKLAEAMAGNTFSAAKSAYERAQDMIGQQAAIKSGWAF